MHFSLLQLIPPRGCAYIQMAERKDAARALAKLKGTQFLGYTLKAAWAPSRIMKDQYKDHWDVEAGAIYVPWSDLPPNVETLAAEGALIDEETLPEHLRSNSHLSFLKLVSDCTHRNRMTDPGVNKYQLGPPCAMLNTRICHQTVLFSQSI